MDALISVATQSLILGIMVLGVYISYSILDFPDLSADGSFALGGAIISVSLNHQLSPIIGILLALLGGAVAGLLTGILHVKLKISNLLSGILVFGILYSINLRIMGRANIPLFNKNHLFKSSISPIILAILIVLACKVLLDLFLKTNLGYTLKGIGDNPQMVASLGIEVGTMKILGLMLSNALVSFSGSILAQYQGFSDISMGIGTLILGIASIIIGQTIFRRIRFLKQSSIILIGTVIYQFTVYLAMNIGMSATDLKMITSFIIVLFLGINHAGAIRKVKIFSKAGV